MKTKHFLFASIVSVVAILACNKLKNTPPHSDSSNVAEMVAKGKMRHIPEKKINLNPTECNNTIKGFKNKINHTAGQQARLIDQENVALDSATWVLEAALNYDFDYNDGENYETIGTTITMTTTINEDYMLVNSTDLENVYSDFNTAIATLENSTTKIKIVDIESYLYDPGTGVVVFEGKITKVNLANLYACTSPVFSTSATGLSVCDATTYSTYFGCSPSTSNTNALIEINKQINCESNSYADCGNNGWYWTNVGSQSAVLQNTAGATGSNPYPSALYCSGFNLLSYYCPAITISVSQANSLYSNLSALAYTPQINSAVHGVTVCVDPHITSGSPVMASICWKMQVDYGTRVCRTESQ